MRDGILTPFGERVYTTHMRRFNLFIPEQAIAKLQALARKTGITVSEHVRRAIDEYLKRTH